MSGKVAKRLREVAYETTKALYGTRSGPRISQRRLCRTLKRLYVRGAKSVMVEGVGEVSLV